MSAVRGTQRQTWQEVQYPLGTKMRTAQVENRDQEGGKDAR